MTRRCHVMDGAGSTTTALPRLSTHRAGHVSCSSASGKNSQPNNTTLLSPSTPQVFTAALPLIQTPPTRLRDQYQLPYMPHRSFATGHSLPNCTVRSVVTSLIVLDGDQLHPHAVDHLTHPTKSQMASVTAHYEDSWTFVAKGVVLLIQHLISTSKPQQSPCVLCPAFDQYSFLSSIHLPARSFFVLLFLRLFLSIVLPLSVTL